MAKTNEKQLLVLSGIKEMLEKEGITVEEAVAEKITKGYMVAVASLWLKVDSESRVANLLKRFENAAELAMQVLENHGFNDVVYTYRKTHLDSKTKKVIANLKGYEVFLQGILDGQVVVESKPAKVVTKVTKKPAVVQSSFVSKFANILNVEVKEEVKEEVKKEVSKKKRGSWVEVNNQTEAELEKAYVRLSLKNKKEFYGKYMYMSTKKNEVPQVVVKQNGIEFAIRVADIQKLSKYVRA